MKKYFNITGPCNRERHYMVNIDKRLQETKALVDNGDYFVINRPSESQTPMCIFCQTHVKCPM